MRRNKVYAILVYDAHLYGELDKCMHILAPQGKYFYIKHDKDGISPHYHIYFTFNELVRLSTVEILFQHYVCSKSFKLGAKKGYKMARKKKESRKYKPLDEFRYNNSPLAEGHLHHVFGVKGGKYKSLGLTHSSESTAKKIKIDNPNPNDKKPSYLQLRVHTAKEKYYSDKVEGLQFTKEARGVVRHRIKQYKKSTNRKPPMWYENKKKNKKK